METSCTIPLKAYLGWNLYLKEVLDLVKQILKNIPLVVGGYKATEIVEEGFAIPSNPNTANQLQIRDYFTTAVVA